MVGDSATLVKSPEIMVLITAGYRYNIAVSPKDRNQNAIDALNLSRKTSQDICALRDQIRKLRLTTMALWELLKKNTGAPDGELNAIFKSLEEKDRTSGKIAEYCPSCGRSLQENSRLCIYCGAEADAKPFP